MTQTLEKIFSCANLNKIYYSKKSYTSSNINVWQIHSKIVNNSYKANRLSFYTLPKSNGKERVICKCSLQDSLIQRALLAYLNTKLPRLGLNNDLSYCIKVKGVRSAIIESVKRRNEKQWVLKADITAFFDSIDRKQLIDKLIDKKRITKNIILILTQIINTEINTKSEIDEATLKLNGIKKGIGLRQGMPLSPLLSSFFLSSFDKYISKKKLNIIRYADDIIFFGSTKEECQKCEEIITKKLKEIGLTIAKSNPDSKTQIYSPEEPVLFLGIEIYKCKKSTKYQQRMPDKKLKEVLKELDKYSKFDNLKKYLTKKKNLTLNLVLEKLKYIADGYSAAYKGASNYEHFKKELNSKLKEVQINLLVSVLGESVFSNLDQEKKQFLGFDL